MSFVETVFGLAMIILHGASLVSKMILPRRGDKRHVRNAVMRRGQG